MTRLELLHILIAQARSNGFEFRKWYTSRLGLPWESTRQSVETLSEQRRYYALLFSHDFASHFWKAGEQITFQVPSQTFTRSRPDGSIATVTRKGYTRRSTRNDVWLYHLRELAASDDPLRVIRKYLRVEDDLDPDQDQSVPSCAKTSPPAAKKPISAGLALVRKSQRHALSQSRPQA
jgi:hypothetical protein